MKFSQGILCLAFLFACLMPKAQADTDDNFTYKQETNIVIVSIIFSAISFFGSSFIVGTYLRHPELRSFVFQLVVWISASDIMFSIGNAIGNPPDGSGACYTQAVFIQFFGLSSAFWTCAIAFTVDRVYLKGHQVGDAIQLKKILHFTVWGVSTLLTILPATTGNYGPSTGWCWIDVTHNKEAGTAWRFICFYIPLWGAAIYNLVVYYNVNKALEEAIQAGAQNIDNIRQLQRMIYYPLVLVVCYAFGTISRIQQIFGPPVYELVIVHTIGMSSQGTLNAIVYGFTPSVRRVIFGDKTRQELPDVGDGMEEDYSIDRAESGAAQQKRKEDGLVSVNLESKSSVPVIEMTERVSSLE